MKMKFSLCLLVVLVASAASAAEEPVIVQPEQGNKVIIEQRNNNTTIDGLAGQSIDIDANTRKREAANPPLPAPQAVQQSHVFPNGFMDSEDFLWTGGGEDPLRISLKDALAIPGLKLSKDVQERFLRAVQSAPGGHDTYTLRHGDKLADFMVSGSGNIAMNPKAMTDDWKAGRSRVVRVWWIRDAEGYEWRFMIPEVCNNLLIKRMGAPAPCVCEPKQGDACVPATS